MQAARVSASLRHGMRIVTSHESLIGVMLPRLLDEKPHVTMALCHAHAWAMMVSVVSNCCRHPNSVRARVASATSRAGSPGRREESTTRISRPVSADNMEMILPRREVERQLDPG